MWRGMKASTCDVASRTSFDSCGDQDGRQAVLRDEAEGAAHGAPCRGPAPRARPSGPLRRRRARVRGLSTTGMKIPNVSHTIGKRGVNKSVRGPHREKRLTH